MDGLESNGELAPAHITHHRRDGLPQKRGKEILQIQLPSGGVFCPMNEGGVSSRIVGLPHEPQPPEILGMSLPTGQTPDHPVKIGGVVKRVALGKNSLSGQRVIALGQVMQPGMGFTPHVGKRDRVGPERGRGGGFIVDGEANSSRQISGPTQVLPETTNDHLQHWNRFFEMITRRRSNPG